MVNQRGQSFIEYLLMLGALTIIGAFIMKSMVGPMTHSSTGAVNSMAASAAKQIAADER